MVDVNYWAVVIAALLYYGGGVLWYSPIMFGKQWMALVDITPEKKEAEKKNAWKAYLTVLVAALLMSYGLARLADYMQVTSFGGGLHLGFWSWVVFVITTMAINNTFSGRPAKLLLIDGGYHLYGLLLMGVIHAVWT
jgi:hypothetical protein